jgi:hypothetical protein
MYSTCLFCHSALGANDAIESFPVGRRLAFDAEKGRLWVVCPACRRWNLSPLEERWEAIEECERRYRATRARVSTDNIGLAAQREGLELVRIGRPLLPEFAAWRYGGMFARRRRRTLIAAGVGAAAAVAASPALLPAILPALSLGTLTVTGVMAPLFVPPGVMLMEAKDWWQWERVVARLPDAQGNTMRVRVKHLWGSTIYLSDAGDAPVLRLLHEDGVDHLEGRRALTASGTLLSRANWTGAGAGLVRGAVRRIEAMGDASRYLLTTAQRFTRFKGKRLFAPYRRIGAMSLLPVERLALEMSVNEESERRALQGELAELAEEWKRAEEIAQIADTL